MFREFQEDAFRSFPDDGLNGIEFFIALTYTQFLQAYKEQEWTEPEGYSQLAKVLNGTLKIVW